MENLSSLKYVLRENIIGKNSKNHEVNLAFCMDGDRCITDVAVLNRVIYASYIA